jgi:hypothetical protein
MLLDFFPFPYYRLHEMVNSERDINRLVKTVRHLPSLPDPISYSNFVSNPAPKITERREHE